jgi:hypothetical protein
MGGLDGTLRVGFAGVDLTPGEPVLLAGQFYARVSEGVADPITATALAFESTRPGGGRGVMVSCDLVSIPENLRAAVDGHLRRELPELDPSLVFLNATHTHTGPECRSAGESGSERYGVELTVMRPEDYVETIGRRIAGAVVAAWQGRRPAAVGFGLGQATVGYNRRMVYADGQSRMYGDPNDPTFSHIEGPADSAVNVIGFWDEKDRLMGVVVNLAAPSQSGEHGWEVSADYWHETRRELRRRLGEDIFILPQCSAAGDVTPAKRNIMIDWRAQERMWRLMEINQRQDIGQRIAEAVAGVVPYAHRELERDPVVRHRAETIGLSRRMLREADVEQALREAEALREQYEALKQELEANPRLRQEPRWYVKITSVYRKMNWNRLVAERFEQQKDSPTVPVTVHVLRLGEVAMATNPFEYYLDYSHRIRARSRAVQTLLVQLAGWGGYLPTRRAVAGGSYGALPASTVVGPEGGEELAAWTVGAINGMWDDAA